MNYYNQEEFDKAKAARCMGITAIKVIVDNTVNGGSAMVYRYEDKIIGITTAHTFENAIRKEFNTTTLAVSFNIGINGSPLTIETSLFKIHPDYKVPETLFDKRDPERVKNDLAVFSIPYFFNNFASHLFNFKLDPILLDNKEYKTTVYSYGYSHTTDLKTFHGLTIEPQKVQATLYYDDQNHLFKQDYESNHLLLKIDTVSHDIHFNILVNKPSKITGLPGDSGANIIDQNTQSTIAMSSGHDYMAFFEKKSPLAQFYGHYVIMTPPSQERTDTFLRNLREYGQVMEEKELGNTRYIAFKSQEIIPCSTLFTPINPHHDFIMTFINNIPITELKTLSCVN